MIIESKQNPAIKNLIKLKETKEIKKSGLCLVESKKVVCDLIKLNRIKEVFVTPDKEKSFRDFNIKLTVISEEIARYLSETKTTDGVFGLCKVIENDRIKSEKVLVLDNVQDPTNVGAIIRSAVAFGFNDIIFIDGAYPFTPKVIRSSMGHVFNVNIFFFTHAKLVDFIKQNHYNLIKADLDGDSIASFRPNLPIALVIGNEGNGISENISNSCSGSVTIPMNDSVESLNASVSAGIIMFEINNKLEK